MALVKQARDGKQNGYVGSFVFNNLKITQDFINMYSSPIEKVQKNAQINTEKYAPWAYYIHFCM